MYPRLISKLCSRNDIEPLLLPLPLLWEFRSGYHSLLVVSRGLNSGPHALDKNQTSPPLGPLVAFSIPPHAVAHVWKGQTQEDPGVAVLQRFHALPYRETLGPEGREERADVQTWVQILLCSAA